MNILQDESKKAWKPEERNLSYYMDHTLLHWTSIDTNYLRSARACVQTDYSDFFTSLLVMPLTAFTRNARGRQLNLGFGTMVTAVSGAMSNADGDNKVVPYALSAHRRKDVQRMEEFLAPIVRSMSAELTCTEYVETMQGTRQWKGIYGTCFDKVNVSISDTKFVPSTPVHTDTNNRGWCVILILGEFEGGEHFVTNAGTNYRIQVEHGTLLIGEYHKIRHAAMPVTSGRRIAIIGYASSKVTEFLDAYAHWKRKGLTGLDPEVRKRARLTHK